MANNYEMEEFADQAVEELREFIDAESKLIQAEHEFFSKLYSWEYIIAHLNERIPPKMLHLHRLSGKITEKLIEIRDIVESGSLQDLSIVKEEKHLISQLEEDIRHKDWRAVKRGSDQETVEEEQVLRLELRELKELHSKFAALMSLMNKNKLMVAIKEDAAEFKDKSEFLKLEEYYFMQIYKFVMAYESIFRHLVQKESMLAKKTKGISKKIKQ